MLDPVEYVAMIAVARRRDLRSCSTCLAAHESVVPFVRKDSASSHKPIHNRTLLGGLAPVPVSHIPTTSELGATAGGFARFGSQRSRRTELSGTSTP